MEGTTPRIMACMGNHTKTLSKADEYFAKDLIFSRLVHLLDWVNFPLLAIKEQLIK